MVKELLNKFIQKIIISKCSNSKKDEKGKPIYEIEHGKF